MDNMILDKITAFKASGLSFSRSRIEDCTVVVTLYDKPDNKRYELDLNMSQPIDARRLNEALDGYIKDVVIEVCEAIKHGRPIIKLSQFGDVIYGNLKDI